MSDARMNDPGMNDPGMSDPGMNDPGMSDPGMSDTRTTGPVRRRSFVLVAVLVITASALLVATSLLFIIDANLAGSAFNRDRTQMRLLAWSGVQAVASRLDEQRDRILGGALPELDAEFVIYERDGVVGMVRLLPVTPDDELLAPQAARLDLNHADAAALVATGLVEEADARAIITHRDAALGGTFQSVAELLGVPGLDIETVYGPVAEIAAAGDERDLGERVAHRLAGAAPRGLADVVTVYGVEPAIQGSGVKRINLNTPWSEELGARVDRRFGPGAGAALRQIMDGGTSFRTEASIFQVLRFFGVDAQEWPQYADTLTAEAGDYHYGRLDINTAPVETLLTLPGIGEEEAAQIVRTRDGLSSEDRATIVWPLLREIVPAEAYDGLAGRITTRSWTYRVRIAASEVVAGREEESGPGATSPMVVEAVIDLCDPKPRIAYLREISHLRTAAILASAASFDPEDPEAAVDEEVAARRDVADGTSAEEPLDGSVASAGSVRDDDEDLEDAFGGTRDQGRSPDENRLSEDLYDDEMMDRRASRPAGPAPGTGRAQVPVSGDVPASGAGPESGASGRPPIDSGTGAAETARQRRIGRWRTGR